MTVTLNTYIWRKTGRTSYLTDPEITGEATRDRWIGSVEPISHSYPSSRRKWAFQYRSVWGKTLTGETRTQRNAKKIVEMLEEASRLADYMIRTTGK